jgi:hypothetical protein
MSLLTELGRCSWGVVSIDMALLTELLLKAAIPTTAN